MLSNKHKYTLLRISRLLLSPFYTLLSFFLKQNNNIVVTAQFNEEYSDNAKALFEILAEHADFKDRVYFVINDSVKREHLNSRYPNKFISNSNFKDALFILRARYWFCSALELPLATFLQRHRRQVIHLGHGMLVKKIGLIESQVSWYKKFYYALVGSSFSYTIATTPFCREDISAGFGIPQDRVLLTPQPKTYQVDQPELVNNKILTDSSSTHILYAPTWRPYAEVDLFPFFDFVLSDFSRFLKSNNIHVWLRLHPRFEHNIAPEILSSQNIHLFSAKEYSEINAYLSYFDALITDYSSIYYDFLTLERPVLFFDYDLDKYNSLVGVIDNYEAIKAAETTASTAGFMEQLLSIKTGGYDLSRIKEINQLVNYPISNDKIANFVLTQFEL